MDFCTDYNFLQGILIVKFFINAALIIVPILLICLGTYDGFKAVISGKSEDLKQIAFATARRCCSVFIVLLLPSIINIVFANFADYNDIANNISLCYNNAESNIIAGLKRARQKEIEGIVFNSENYISSYNSEKYKRFQSQATSSNTSVSGQGNFQKYELTDEQLRGLAALCKQEQGTVEGAAAEASLMANLYELRDHAAYGEGGEGLYNYVKNCKWFANAPTHMAKGSTTPQEYVDAVKMVLVEGKRTLPAYIDEHDYIGDIAYVTTNGQTINKNDRSAYVSHNTIIHQGKSVGSGQWIYYKHPTETSDPFGYTREENRTNFGDDCYAFSQITSS